MTIECSKDHRKRFAYSNDCVTSPAHCWREEKEALCSTAGRSMKILLQAADALLFAGLLWLEREEETTEFLSVHSSKSSMWSIPSSSRLSLSESWFRSALSMAVSASNSSSSAMTMSSSSSSSSESESRISGSLSLKLKDSSRSSRFRSGAEAMSRKACLVALTGCWMQLAKLQGSWSGSGLSELSLKISTGRWWKFWS